MKPIKIKPPFKEEASSTVCTVGYKDLYSDAFDIHIVTAQVVSVYGWKFCLIRVGDKFRAFDYATSLYIGAENRSAQKCMKAAKLKFDEYLEQRDFILSRGKTRIANQVESLLLWMLKLGLV